MMKKNLCSLVLVLAFCIIGSSVYGQESVALKYNFKEGKTFRMTMSMNTTIVQSMMGQEMKVVADAVSKSEMKFTKVDPEGNATATMSIISMSVKTSAMGREEEENKTDFKKDGMIMVFSPSGKVSTKITDTTLSSIESISNMKFFLLPVRDIKIGEKWFDKQIDTMQMQPTNPITFMTTSTDSEYTLIGKEIKDGRELYKISTTGTLEIAGKGKKSGMYLFVEGTGQASGFFYFDPSISMVVYSESDGEINNKITVTGQQNMTIPMSQKMKIVMTLEEL